MEPGIEGLVEEEQASGRQGRKTTSVTPSTAHPETRQPTIQRTPFQQYMALGPWVITQSKGYFSFLSLRSQRYPLNRIATAFIDTLDPLVDPSSRVFVRCGNACRARAGWTALEV